MFRRVLYVVLTLTLALTTMAAGSPHRSTVHIATPTTPAADPSSTERPLVSALGYQHPGGYVARVRPGGGDTETTFPLPVGKHGRVLWGDWWGRGTETPAVFHAGEWRLYGGAFGNASVATTVHFGGRGDRPVVGDWDADGRTDLGVVRNGTWRLAVTRSAHPNVWRQFAFGPRDGQPLAGDWDDAGVDGIAVYRAGVWWVRQTAARSARTKVVRFAFYPKARRKAATAVAGDWSGTGRDGIALVRGDLWKLAPRVGADPTQIAMRRIDRPRGASPVTWKQAAGPRGTLCPTATGAPGPDVVATLPPGLDLPPTDPESDAGTALSGSYPDRALVRESLERSTKFLLASRFDVPWTPQPGQSYVDLLADHRRQEYAVRRPAMAALAVAVTLATGVHDDETSGASLDAAEVYVERIVRSIACQHLSVTPGGWGHGWQTGHWAQLTAEAAWLVWDRLDAQTQADVTAMLLDEADHQLTEPVEYWRDRLGNPLPAREGNTAAEEMAWDVALLELAHAMFPEAPNARAYRRNAVEWAVAAYARPTDLLDLVPVNGVAPALRLTGTNALEDGTVVNHHRLEPDYMGNIQHLWWAADFALLAGTDVPEAVWFNARHVYGAFSTVSFTPGEPSAAGEGRTYVEPGGTIYRRDVDEVYFPDGTAWGAARRAPFVSIDAHAFTYGLVPEEAWPALDALDSHVHGQLALSYAAGDSGRTYAADPSVAATQDTYYGREEYAAQQVASAWLTLYLAPWGAPAVDDGFYGVPGGAHQRQTPPPPRPPSP